MPYLCCEIVQISRMTFFSAVQVCSANFSFMQGSGSCYILQFDRCNALDRPLLDHATSTHTHALTDTQHSKHGPQLCLKLYKIKGVAILNDGC